MVAVIGLSVSRLEQGVEALERLPRPPALRWSGFLVGPGQEIKLVDVASWAAEVRGRREYVPIGLVGHFCGPDFALLAALEVAGTRFGPVLNYGLPPTPVLTSLALRELRDQTIEAVIVEHWSRTYRGVHTRCRPLLEAVAAHGVRGGRAYTLRISESTRRRLSEKTIRRRLTACGLPSLGSLLREARIMSVSLRRDRGASRRDAVRAAGWSSIKLFEKAAKRTM